MKKKLLGNDGRLWFWAGLFVVLCQAFPFLMLGQDTVVNYHDQLDGEMIAYILQAKHLFQGGILPEFMGGMSKTALLPPAPFFVPLFLTGNYFGAYVIMHMTGCLTGYIGMFLLSGEVTGRKWVQAMTGVLFAFLPFLPVYGLSQFGIPLLLWFFLRMREGRLRFMGLLYVFLYGGCSSLVLSGFGILGLLAVGLLAYRIWSGITGRKSGEEGVGVTGRSGAGSEEDGKGSYGFLWLAWGLLLVTYAVENLPLLRQMASGAEVSHKAEYVLAPVSFAAGFLEAFLKGGQHSEDYHIWILAAVLLAVVWLLFRKKGVQREAAREQLKKAGLLFGCIVGLAFCAALWDISPIVELRNRMQALGAFQAGRVLWISPVFWYLLGAWAVHVLAENLSSVRGIREKAGTDGRRLGLPAAGTDRRRPGLLAAAAGLSMAASLAAMGLTGILALKNGNWKANLYRILDKEYPSISYGEYYAVGVMEQVEQYIREHTGLTQEQYQVVSLGIDPAAAYYHGFYCLDGYSNNYSLEYKHRFRAVIEPELEKSSYLKEYFDNWGNRCYLSSAECPGYYTIEKNGFYFQDYELDTEALGQLGGRFLLSAAYIQNAQEEGLKLLREEPFETPESYYRIFLYEME